MDIIYRINGGALTLLANQTSPTNIAGTAGDSVEVWLSEKQTATVLAASASIPSLTETYEAFLGSTAASQVESGTFTLAGTKPILVLVQARSNSDIDNPLTSATIGSSGRGYGTGTSLTFIARQRNQRANVYAYWLAAPASGTQTIQVEFTDTSTRWRSIQVYEVNDCSGYSATGTNGSTSNVASGSVGVTTTVANSLVVATIARAANSNETSGGDQTAVYDYFEANWGANVQRVDAATTGTYTTSWSWTTTCPYAALGVELLA